MRERIDERPQARGRKLIEVPGYTVHAVATTLELGALDVWRLYNSGAECENRERAPRCGITLAVSRGERTETS